MLYTVTVLHNTTRPGDPPPLLGHRPEDRLLPGDTLTAVGTLTLSGDTITDAADRTYALTYGVGAAHLLDTYRGWGVRALHFGDVLAISEDAPDGARHLLACAPGEWNPLTDLDAYTVITDPTSTHAPHAPGSPGALGAPGGRDVPRRRAGDRPDRGDRA